MGRLAVVGSLSALENTGDRGPSAVRSSFVVSALEGLTDRLGEEKIISVARDVLTAAERARIASCDAAVVVVGLTWRDEGEKIPLIQGGGDRDSLRLSEAQEALVREVCALCPRTVVVLQGGSAVEVRPFVDLVPALLVAWYPGMLGGEALSDVLLGRVCPSGKLPITFAQSSEDLVPFDHRSHAVRYGYLHGYRYLERNDRAAEFPFGFGLSYTRFALEALTLDRAQMAPADTLTVSVEVCNVGARAGAEVVQLYLSCEHAQVERPLRWLGGFGRVPLEPGERKRLVMRISARELARYDAQLGRFVVDAGWYGIAVGSSSQELPLSARFQVR
jgi:beta-glucosidase